MRPPKNHPWLFQVQQEMKCPPEETRNFRIGRCQRGCGALEECSPLEGPLGHSTHLGSGGDAKQIQPTAKARCAFWITFLFFIFFTFSFLLVFGVCMAIATCLLVGLTAKVCTFIEFNFFWFTHACNFGILFFSCPAILLVDCLQSDYSVQVVINAL